MYQSDNISLTCKFDIITPCRSDCVVLGDFNCAKANWVSNTARPNTVYSQLLNFCSDSLLHHQINPAHLNVQTIATLALECRWEFPEDCSLNELWTSFRDQISFLTSKATPSSKAHKRPLQKPYYTRRVKRAIQRHHEAWTAWKNSQSSSCGIAYLRHQQEQRRSWRILRAERLSCECRLANSAKTAPKKIFAHVNRNKQFDCTHPAATLP